MLWFDYSKSKLYIYIYKLVYILNIPEFIGKNGVEVVLRYFK